MTVVPQELKGFYINSRLDQSHPHSQGKVPGSNSRCPVIADANKAEDDRNTLHAGL